MDLNSTNRSLFERLFDHDHFRSLDSWRIDALVCLVFSAALTPADPFSLLIVFVPLVVVWISVRYVIARRLQKMNGVSQLERFD